MKELFKLISYFIKKDTIKKLNKEFLNNENISMTKVHSALLFF
jgi:hypothetical protein